MPAIVNYGDNEFYAGGSVYAMDSSRLFSTSSHLDVYRPPTKRARVNSPIFYSGRSLDSLPDECLFEIFRRLPNGQPKSAAACVSKKWLYLLSSIRNSEIEKESKSDVSSDNVESESDGFLTRCLEGKKVTDVRLAAIAVGISSRGGLGKLSIRGNRSTRDVTDLGLSAVARGCPSLRTLSIWSVSTIGDQGLYEDANECHLLEKLDLCRCPWISDQGLIAIAKNSPSLRTLTIEACPRIGNASLQAIAKWCPKLQSVSIRDCSLVGDEGMDSLLSVPGSILSKLNIDRMSLSDYTLAAIGLFGKALTSLTLSGLQNVTEKGFWAMGKALGLTKLSSLSITSCSGMTDLSVEAIGKGCPSLNTIYISKCCFVSDNGLVAFARAALVLEKLQLEECNRITQLGLLGAISCSNSKLKSLTLVKCLGVKDLNVDISSLSACESLQKLYVQDCPGFGDASLIMMGRLCPNLRKINFSGLCKITDEGLLPLVEICDGLRKVNLKGCLRLTDNVVSAIVRVHGGTIEVLNLEGCVQVTDVGLLAIAYHCLVLSELDVSKCSITDVGIAALSREKQVILETLSLAYCSKISNKSVPSLRKLGKTLKCLNLQHCNSISCSAVYKLVESLWHCDVLSYSREECMSFGKLAQTEFVQLFDLR